jgi:hypothetical protein
MVTWPASLPQSPLVEGWTEQFADNAYRFKPRQGLEITRRKQSTRFNTQTLNFKLSKAQRQTFEDFYYDDCGGGVLSFEWEHPVTKVTYDFKWTESPPQMHSPDGGKTFIVSLSLMRIS